MEDFKWIKIGDDKREKILKSLQGKSYEERIKISIGNNCEWLFDYLYDDKRNLRIISMTTQSIFNDKCVMFEYFINGYFNHQWITPKFKEFIINRLKIVK